MNLLRTEQIAGFAGLMLYLMLGYLVELPLILTAIVFAAGVTMLLIGELPQLRLSPVRVKANREENFRR